MGWGWTVHTVVAGQRPTGHIAMTIMSTSPEPMSPKPMPSRGYLAVIRAIDKFTELTGYLFVLSIIPLIFANVIEVFARYVLKATDDLGPRRDDDVLRGPVHAGLGTGAAKGAHIRTDMLWEKFSDRTKGMIDSLAFLLFFLPTMVVLFFISIDDFLYSLSIDERGELRRLDAGLVAAARRHSAGRLHAVPAGHLGADEEPLGLAHRRVPGQAREDRGLRTMTFAEALGLVMLVGMVVVIFIGFPISFTLLFLALIFGGMGLGWEQTFNLAYLQIWGTMKDEIFPAVPLFIFMGYMTEQAGLMERLFGALRSLLAPVRGSLYLAVILTATIFAMATGIVGAAVTVLGIMAGADDDQDRLRRAAVGRRDRRRRHARHSGPAQRHAGGDGPGHGRARQSALFGGVRPGLPARRLLHRLYAHPQLHQSEARSGDDHGGAQGRLRRDDHGKGRRSRGRTGSRRAWW